MVYVNKNIINIHTLEIKSKVTRPEQPKSIDTDKPDMLSNNENDNDNDHDKKTKDCRTNKKYCDEKDSDNNSKDKLDKNVSINNNDIIDIKSSYEDKVIQKQVQESYHYSNKLITQENINLVTDKKKSLDNQKNISSPSATTPSDTTSTTTSSGTDSTTQKSQPGQAVNLNI